MSIQILYFGKLADITGLSKEMMNRAEGKTVGELKGLLLEKYPDFLQSKFQVALNKEIVNDDIIISQHDELALLPPFAGG